MYKMTCDGLPLLDARDETLILTTPKVKLADNTVGSCSFKIFKNHPYYDRLTMLKSIFEVSDEFGVIFRGRMTGNTRDIKKGKAVDLEGLMAFFNDSIVRPYTFPDDWEDEDHPDHASYTEAAENGNVVEYFLAWLINQHNAQVADFQKFKIGTVTVEDPNNYIERASSEYPNTWEELRSKLFESSLNGHLCIRYEADGNYIDYLAEFTEVNEQGITYGENLRDFSRKDDGTETYSAIIPRGAEVTGTKDSGDSYEGMYGTITGATSTKEKLTIKDLPDGDITDDIVKSGDMLYSKKAVAAYGWRFVPASESVWDDVTEAENLQTKGVGVLEGTLTNIPSRIEVKAVDLHCTDEQIRSFRIYKKIPVRILPHDINSDFDITSLDIDLLNPQNTDLVAGKTVMTFTDLQNKYTSEIKNLLGSLATTKQLENGFRVTESLIEKTQESILLQVSETYVTSDSLTGYATTEELTSQISIAKTEILQSVSGTYITEDALTGFATTEEVESKISTAIDGIDLSVYATKEAVDESFKELEVGGRNYILSGKGDKKQGFFENFAKVADGYGEHTLTSQKTYKAVNLAPGFVLGCFDYEVGKQMTWSYDIMITAWDFPEGTSVNEWWMGQRYGSPTWHRCTSHSLPRIDKGECELNQWVHVEQTVTIPEQAAEGVAEYASIQFYNPSADAAASITFRIKNVKLEYGNKATDWTPAPEEYSTTEEVNNSIKLAIDGIDLTAYKAFTDLEGNVQDAEAKLSLAVLTDESGNLQSKIHIGADLLTIETDNFTLDPDGTIKVNEGKLGIWTLNNAYMQTQSYYTTGSASQGTQVYHYQVVRLTGLGVSVWHSTEGYPNPGTENPTFHVKWRDIAYATQSVLNNWG